MIKNAIIGLMFSLAMLGCTGVEKVRITEDFNFDWKFHLGDEAKAFEVNYNDSAWENIRLPHDWSVAHSFTQENTGGATAFLPGGIGWYRKKFHVPLFFKDRMSWVEFDGIYTNSEVWINGHYLGKRPYGYAPFSYLLSPHLRYGEENVIVVKADRSAFLDSRWYPGSGIYRNVKLVTVHKSHIPQWGVFITTPHISEQQAEVKLACDYVLDDVKRDFKIKNTIYFKGKVVASNKSDVNTITKGRDKGTLSLSVKVPNPKLWDVTDPNMYTAVTELLVDGKVCDVVENNFGIRSFHFDAEKGFFLNGKKTLLKGVCLHHDGGLVGAAVPRGVWERRLRILKQAGCNAIRTAHNPPSEEFLDICDEMGFLVQDEAFDEFQNPKDKRNNYNQQSEDEETKGYTYFFDEWSERDLTNMVLRDRNHPSIIMWSIGNEIEWTFPKYGNATGYWGSTKVGDVNYYWDEPPLSIEKIKELFYQSGDQDILVETAHKLSSVIKRLDTSRPVTANLVIPSVSMFSGYADALDIVGLSYRHSVYDYCRRNYPDKVILGTENWTRYHEWKPVVENDYMSGIFMWTGINYMGESHQWPFRGNGSGLLDFAGFEKPSYHMFRSLWNKKPHVFICTQTIGKSPYLLKNDQQLDEKVKDWSKRQKWGWQEVNRHWNYMEGDTVIVEVYTNQEAVELFLNGTSQGVKKLSEVNDHILKWAVPYKGGEIKAQAVNGSAESVIKTAKDPVDVSIQVDKRQLVADGYDVAHVEVQLIDKDVTPVRHFNRQVKFDISGPVKLLGVDNGSPGSVQDYQSQQVITSEGRCLMILQSTREKGKAEIAVTMGAVTKRIELEIH